MRVSLAQKYGVWTVRVDGIPTVDGEYVTEENEIGHQIAASVHISDYELYAAWVDRGAVYCAIRPTTPAAPSFVKKALPALKDAIVAKLTELGYAVEVV